MKKLLTPIRSLSIALLLSLVVTTNLYGQTASVIINEYTRNGSDISIELLVIQDNLDMRGFNIRLSDRNHANWTNTITFKTQSAFQNLRAGTFIVIETGGGTDADPSDGYLHFDYQTEEINDFAGTSPSYLGFNGVSMSAMDNFNNGMIVQLRNASSTHVHAVAHSTTAAGLQYTLLPAPKAFVTTSMPSSIGLGLMNSNYGASASYATTSPATTGFGNIAANITWIKTLREPTWTGRALSVSRTGINTATLTWTAMTDVYPADQYSGYIILRSVAAVAVTPTDGVNYAVGNTIGASTVIANVTGSGTLTFVDTTADNCTKYYYRVVPYRFTTNGTTAQERGRAYNQAQYADNSVNSVVANATNINGPGNNCVDGVDTYSTTALVGVVSYDWTIPAGGTLLSGQSSTSINVRWNISLTGFITVTPNYGCANGGSASLAITVFEKPSTSNIIY